MRGARGSARTRPQPAGPPPPSASPACGPRLPAHRSFLGAAEPAGPTALPRGDLPFARQGATRGRTRTHTKDASTSRRFQDPRVCCLEAGNAAALTQPFHTVYGFKDRSCIKPCPSPDKGTERDTAGPDLPGPWQIEDA